TISSAYHDLLHDVHIWTLAKYKRLCRMRYKSWLILTHMEVRIDVEPLGMSQC
uniref:Uncharacterized protein n=1 Tax=Parascaris univalens TaxID=6257 RepID=A0A915CA58_PARUN